MLNCACAFSQSELGKYFEWIITIFKLIGGARVGTVVKALISQHCGPAPNPGTDTIICVEFVVGSLLCSERFFSGYSGFPLSSKTNTSKFDVMWNARRRLNEFIRTSKCFVGKQITKLQKIATTKDRDQYYFQAFSTVLWGSGVDTVKCRMFNVTTWILINLFLHVISA